MEGLAEVFAAGRKADMDVVLVKELHTKIDELTMEQDFFSARVGVLSRAERLALVDRLLRHCHTVNIQGNSYRMREHRELRESMQRPGGGDEVRQGAAS